MEVVTTSHKELAPTTLIPADQHPVAVYLAGLAEGSRRPMVDALDVIASILSNEQLDAKSLNWSAIRFQHTAAVRSKLAEAYSSRMSAPSPA